MSVEPTLQRMLRDVKRIVGIVESALQLFVLSPDFVEQIVRMLESTRQFTQPTLLVWRQLH
jgi:hypothetical protein